MFADALQQRDAFVAHSNEFSVLLGENQVIPFNTLLSNYSMGFNTATYTFTCQHSGLYLFSTTLVNYYYWNKLGARIVKDGQPISSSVYLDNYAREWNQGSVSSVVHCGKGERVWVESSRKCKLHGGIETESYTQFSGTLLQIDF